MLPFENNNIFAIEMYTAFVPFGRKIGGITDDRWHHRRSVATRAIDVVIIAVLKKKNSSDNG